MEVFRRPAKELFRLFFADHIPVPDEAREHRRDPAAGRYFIEIRPFGGHDPFFRSHLSGPLNSTAYTSKGTDERVRSLT